MRPLSSPLVALVTAAIFLPIVTTSLAGSDLSDAIRTDPSLAPTPPAAPEYNWEEVTLFGDIGETLSIAWDASYSQLLHSDTLLTLAVGTAATWITDDNDDAWLADLEETEFLTNGLFDSIGDQAALALAAAPVVTWLISNWTQDEKLHRYSIETMSAIVLTYAEVEIITNVIPTHERPRNENGDPASNFFDTAFRGKYSFPSGHLIGPFIVTLKTYDYYGWKAAILPAAVTGVSSFNRIADGSHYPSDVVAAAVLSLSAHLSTRRETSERDGGFHWGAAPVAGGGLMLTGGFDF
jgi:hypothetical protein